MQDEEAAEIRRQVIRLVLELFCIEGSIDREYLSMYLCDWYQNQTEWKEEIEATLQRLVCASVIVRPEFSCTNT